MHIGIDLGTTYSCVAYINEEGIPSVIYNSDNMESTPSVVFFDSKQAFVGKKANDRKIMPSSPVFEFIKRDIGKPKNNKYQINGYYYGAVGLSAIILRKLKKESISFFKKKGLIDSAIDEKSILLQAVITVPAYFGDLQRQETKLAGYAAGLEVIGIINEPTAAALAYGKKASNGKKIMVFDLGGGTFDATILEMNENESIVIASDGADHLGGKDWDEIIQKYIYTEFYKLTGKMIPDDLGWEIQQKALQAKFDLTEQDETIVSLSIDGNDIDIPLYRKSTKKEGDMELYEMDSEEKFYFEERSSSLLALLRAICNRMLIKANLIWGDIDEFILAGGSCRMPMIASLIEELAGKRIERNIPGFSYDTAIAMGAAIYGMKQGNLIKDVTSKTIGIELKANGVSYIEPVIFKNRQIPLQINQSYTAEPNAVLKIYEGESVRVDECILRGRLELGNPEGKVDVTLAINNDGELMTLVQYPPAEKRTLNIVNDDQEIDKVELKQKIHSLDIRL